MSAAKPLVFKGFKTMLGWMVTAAIVALIAGVLGFSGIAGAAIGLAKTIFFVAIGLFLIAAAIGLVRGCTSFPRKHPVN